MFHLASIRQTCYQTRKLNHEPHLTIMSSWANVGRVVSGVGRTIVAGRAVFTHLLIGQVLMRSSGTANRVICTQWTVVTGRTNVTNDRVDSGGGTLAVVQHERV